MSHREYKQRLYSGFARIGQALASDKRLEILDLLAQAPRHVDALAAETDMSVANVSQHLQILRAARLVKARREGTKTICTIAGDDVLRLWLALRAVGQNRLAEVEQLTREFTVNPNDSQCSRADLEILLREGHGFLLDVRPQIEFEAGHLPGAVSIPVAELPARLAEIPRGERVIAYCRGEYCLMADQAVSFLREHGFDAVRLEGGWPEWRLEGRLTSMPADVARR
jgi:rhodanese-related sulfurtransferase/DNA-binding transcriptional ArsR family regulator